MENLLNKFDANFITINLTVKHMVKEFGTLFTDVTVMYAGKTELYKTYMWINKDVFDDYIKSLSKFNVNIEFWEDIPEDLIKDFWEKSDVKQSIMEAI